MDEQILAFNEYFLALSLDCGSFEKSVWSTLNTRNYFAEWVFACLRYFAGGFSD